MKKIVSALAILLVLLCVVVVGISALATGGTGGNDGTKETNTNGDSNPLVDVPSDKHTVKYVAKSNKPASVHYTNPTGGDSEEDFTDSWTKEITIDANDTDNMLSLSVTSMANGRATVSCELWVDGKKVDSKTSTGRDFVNATCGDFLP